MIGLFQPEVGRRLSGHPITNKLVMAVNFKPTANVNSSVTVPIPEDTGRAGPGSWLRASVVYAQGTNIYGAWEGFGGVGANSQFLWARTDFIPTGGGCTILTVYEKADSTNRNSCAWSLNTPVSYGSQCAGTLPFGDGVAYWDYGGSVAGTTRLATSGLTWTGPNRWVHTTGGRGMELWQNGLLKNSNSANPTRTAENTIPFVLGARSNGSGIFSDIAHYNVFAMWARQLTQDEIMEVSYNPYILWGQSNFLTIYAPIVGGGALEGGGSGHPVDEITRLTPYALSGKRYGSFAGKPAGGALTHYSLAAATGSYTIVGTTEALQYGRRMVVVAGSYSVAGQNAALGYSGESLVRVFMADYRRRREN